MRRHSNEIDGTAAISSIKFHPQHVRIKKCGGSHIKELAQGNKLQADTIEQLIDEKKQSNLENCTVNIAQYLVNYLSLVMKIN